VDGPQVSRRGVVEQRSRRLPRRVNQEPIRSFPDRQLGNLGQSQAVGVLNVGKADDHQPGFAGQSRRTGNSSGNAPSTAGSIETMESELDEGERNVDPIKLGRYFVREAHVAKRSA